VVGNQYEVSVFLQARMLSEDAETIGWAVTGGGFDSGLISPSFETNWIEDPTAEIEKRLGEFVDQIPELVLTLRKG
jgi:hypothetical protein